MAEFNPALVTASILAELKSGAKTPELVINEMAKLDEFLDKNAKNSDGATYQLILGTREALAAALSQYGTSITSRDTDTGGGSNGNPSGVDWGDVVNGLPPINLKSGVVGPPIPFTTQPYLSSPTQAGMSGTTIALIIGGLAVAGIGVWYFKFRK